MNRWGSGRLDRAAGPLPAPAVAIVGIATVVVFAAAVLAAIVHDPGETTAIAGPGASTDGAIQPGPQGGAPVSPHDPLGPMPTIGRPDRSEVTAPPTTGPSSVTAPPGGDGTASPTPTTTTTTPGHRASGHEPCPTAPEGYPRWGQPHPSLCIRFDPDTTTVRQGESIPGTLLIENRSNDDWELASNDSCKLQRGLFRDTDWVGGSAADEPCTMAFESTHVPANSIVALEVELDTLEREPSADDSDRRQPLPPGRYDAAAGHKVVTSSEPFTVEIWWAPPVEITIEPGGPGPLADPVTPSG